MCTEFTAAHDTFALLRAAQDTHAKVVHGRPDIARFRSAGALRLERSGRTGWEVLYPLARDEASAVATT